MAVDLDVLGHLPDSLLACAAELSRLIFRSLERVASDSQAAGVRALLARRMHSRCSSLVYQLFTTHCMLNIKLPPFGVSAGVKACCMQAAILHRGVHGIYTADAHP